MPVRIAPGDVIEMFLLQARPNPKTKLVVIVAYDAPSCTYLGVVINTAPNTNVHDLRVLKNLHIPMLAKDHSFLDYDSFVDCSSPVEIPEHQIVNSLLSDGVDDVHKCSLPLAEWSDYAEKVKGASTVERLTKVKFFGLGAVRPRRPRLPKKQ